MEVYKLNKNELRDVMWNLALTKHARQRLIERYGMHPKGNGECLIQPAMEMCFAYMNTDGYINVGISPKEYIVISPKVNCYLVITYKEPSENGYTIYDKYSMAKKGVLR